MRSNILFPHVFLCLSQPKTNFWSGRYTRPEEGQHLANFQKLKKPSSAFWENHLNSLESLKTTLEIQQLKWKEGQITMIYRPEFARPRWWDRHQIWFALWIPVGAIPYLLTFLFQKHNYPIPVSKWDILWYRYNVECTKHGQKPEER